MSNLDRLDHSRLNVDYTGEGAPLFRLALKTTMLTVVTLGFYRFWARTRLRRYYWSALRPGGDPFEYTGTGLEKFLGFLIAVAFLSVYLGLFNSALIFGGLIAWPFGDGSFNEASMQLAFNLSFLALLPVIFYAQYRGRRYMLSRTRWRGIRFGAEQAAFGYMWRAIGHTILTVITLGVLLPRQTYFLEKYMYDRTWFGDGQFEMGGKWQELWPAMKHLVIGVLILGGSGAMIALGSALVVLGFIGLIVGYVWAFVGFVHYGIKSFEIMAGQKRLNGDVLFVSEPSTGKVIGQTLLGSFIASTIASFILAVGLAVLAVFARIFGVFDVIDFSDPTAFDGMIEGSLPVLVIAGFIPGYVLFLAFFFALSQVFITQPILEHYAAQTQVINPEALMSIEQRAQDDFADAEGFADALDVGAAI
ncbi:MAG: DUF898 family protein [Pseudomonadota bacterium]